MNCDALSITGERLVVASKILLLLQTFDETSQTYATSQSDIFSIFLLISAVKSIVDSTSTDPVSSASIYTFITSMILDFRRNDVLIPMVDIENLLTFLNNYRLVSDEVFVNLQTDTLTFDNGTDLKTTITGLDTRLTADEAELHAMAQAMDGTDFMQSESSM